MTRSNNVEFNAADTLIRVLSLMSRHKSGIEAALEVAGNRYTFNDVVKFVVHGEFDVYDVDGSILIAKVEATDNARDFCVFIAAGSLKPILAFEDALIREASMRMCSRLVIHGRRGWEKPLQNLGWTHSMSIMTKEI